MPSTTSETPTRAASHQAGQVDALDEGRRLLCGSEASGERAISEAVHAFSELVAVLLPGVVTQPARAVDLTLDLIQLSMNLQRQLLHEVLAAVHVAMVEAGWHYIDIDVQANDTDGVTRRRSTRKAA